MGRLSSLSDDLPGGATYDLTTTFAYSPASQLVGRTRSNPAPYAWSGYTNVSRAYTVNGLNQYATVGSATIGYDANGNLVSDGATSYTYDAENRLVVTSYGGGTTLVYDPLGRLYGFAGTATKSSVYDGDQRIVDYSSNASVIQFRYVLGPGTDNPLIWYAGGDLSDRRSLQADERGSIVSVVDSTGALIGINSYDEYGIPATDPVTGAVLNVGRYGYTGQVWITTLGMWYYKARFYSPTLGRFMQTDPIGYADQNNLYAYVGNDPLNNADPTGLATTGSHIDPDVPGVASGFSGGYVDGGPDMAADDPGSTGKGSARAGQGLDSPQVLTTRVSPEDRQEETSNSIDRRMVGVRIKGETGEEVARRYLIKAGFTIVAEQVYVRDSAGRLRITDFVVRLGGRRLGGYEVKFGHNSRSPRQLSVDTSIARSGGTVISRNKEFLPYGTPVNYSTQELRVSPPIGLFP